MRFYVTNHCRERLMPVEIKELHIRLAITAPAGATTKSAAGGAGDEKSRDALVAECVEQVMQILHNKMER